ncbi:MAG TPA: hypothetical protein VK129_04125, partial [Terriglobales bacterium]|nr:hypothetical protein [Terriglobales bacterium]
MLGKRIFLLIVLLMGLCLPAVAEGDSVRAPKTRTKVASAAARKRAELDPGIVEALKGISSARVRHTIEMLVEFGNRSTLSSAQPAASGRGITAARDWIKSEFESYSKDCGGCLDVQLDTFIQPKSERVPQLTEISNVYAILHGTDSESDNRIVLVTGH